jgi:hypothetical protein
MRPLSIVEASKTGTSVVAMRLDSQDIGFEDTDRLSVWVTAVFTLKQDQWLVKLGVV